MIYFSSRIDIIWMHSKLGEVNRGDCKACMYHHWTQVVYAPMHLFHFNLVCLFVVRKGVREGEGVCAHGTVHMQISEDNLRESQFFFTWVPGLNLEHQAWWRALSPPELSAPHTEDRYGTGKGCFWSLHFPFLPLHFSSTPPWVISFHSD